MVEGEQPIHTCHFMIQGWFAAPPPIDVSPPSTFKDLPTNNGHCFKYDI